MSELKTEHALLLITLADILKNHPELRFGQALTILRMVEDSSTGTPLFYKSDRNILKSVTLSQADTHYIKIIEKYLNG